MRMLHSTSYFWAAFGTILFSAAIVCTAESGLYPAYPGQSDVFVPMQMLFNVVEGDRAPYRVRTYLTDITATGLGLIAETRFPPGEFSPDGKSIAFSSCSHLTDAPGIYVARVADGTSRNVMPQTGRCCGEVRWSPDGKRLSVALNDQSLYIIDLATERITKLPNPGRISGHCWNPQGNKIVFDRRQGNNCELFVTDMEGHEQQLTFQKDFNDHQNWSPTWSPDGSAIAFVSNYSLYTIAAEGGELKRLSIPGRVYYPRWSPDGKWIVFLMGRIVMRIRKDGRDLTTVGELRMNVKGPFSLGVKK